MMDLKGTAGFDNETSPVAHVPQACWRFLHEGHWPEPLRDSYNLRQRLKPLLGDDLMAHLSVKYAPATVALIARTPQASAWMEERLSDVLGAMSSLCGRVMPVTPYSAPVGLMRTGQRWLHTIPTLVVARSKGKTSDWSGWRHNELDADHVAQLRSLICDGINAELAAWSPRELSSEELVVIDPGRPMPLVRGDGPRGMARLRVRFVAPWSLSGHVFIGHHTLLGCGLVKAGGALPAAQA